MSFSLAHLEKLHCWVLAPASPPSSLSQLLRLLTRNNSCTFSFIWRNCRCFYNLPTSALTSVVISTLGRAVSVLTFSSLLRSGNSVSTRVTGCHRLTPAAPSHNSHSSEILSCHYWAPVPIGDYTVYRIRPQPPPHNPPGSWVHSLCSVLPNTLIFFHLSYSKV